jgi:ribonuclease HI
MNNSSTSPQLSHVEIYTDGGCEPNPGPGGYGVVLLHPRKRAEASGGFRLTTNNRMEIFAAIAGLEMLKQPCKVTLYSDRRCSRSSRREEALINVGFPISDF